MKRAKYATDLSDQEWAQIEGIIPRPKAEDDRQRMRGGSL
jgi:transposase